MEAAASNVASHNPQLTGWDGKHIVPIAADELVGGEVARCELQARTLGQPARKQAALQECGRYSLHRQLPSLDRPSEPFGDHLQQFGIGNVERVGMKPAYVEHTDQFVVRHEERYAEHGADPFLPKDRVRYRGRIDPIQPHRLF